jgi:hypothetical protein
MIMPMMISLILLIEDMGDEFALEVLVKNNRKVVVMWVIAIGLFCDVVCHGVIIFWFLKVILG